MHWNPYESDVIVEVVFQAKTTVWYKKLEKHSESADLRQAAHSRVHARQESFKNVLDPEHYKIW